MEEGKTNAGDVMRGIRLFLTTAMLSAVFSNHTRGQDQLPTDQNAIIYSKHGNIFGCGIEFRAMAKDFPYKQGNIVAITGSVSWFALDNTVLGLTLKMLANDVEMLGGQATLVPFKIEHAYFKHGKTLHQSHATVPCDRPLGFCAAGDMDQAIAAMEAFYSGQLEVGYTREGGTMDVRVSTGQLPQAEEDKFLGCITNLLDSLKAEAEKAK